MRSKMLKTTKMLFVVGVVSLLFMILEGVFQITGRSDAATAAAFLSIIAFMVGIMHHNAP